MRKYLCATAAAAVAALLTAIPALASSNAVLSYGSPNPNGTNVGVSDTINGTLSGNATFYTTTTGTTGVKCTSGTTGATVTGNPTASGTANLTLNSMPFSGCTINISGVLSLDSFAIDNLSYNVAITSPPPDSVVISAGSSGPIHATAKVTTLLFQHLTCGYHAHNPPGTVSGTAGNGTNTISFSNAQFDGDGTNSGQCVSTVYFTATYTEVDHTNGDAKVYAN